MNKTLKKERDSIKVRNKPSTDEDSKTSAALRKEYNFEKRQSEEATDSLQDNTYNEMES